MNRLAHLLNKEHLDKWEKFSKEQKWLKNMSKDEIRNGYEEVQRELKENENGKD